MAFLNENMLKQFSSTGITNTLASPSVVGTGIAGATAYGIWQLLKDTKKQNKEILQTNKIGSALTSSQNISGKLLSSLSTYDRIAVKSGRTAYERNLLALVARISTTNNVSNKDLNLKQQSSSASFGDKLFSKMYDYNPLAQFAKFITSGKTPNTLRELFGTNSSKEEKELEKEINKTSMLYGVNRADAALYQQGYLNSVLINVRTPAEGSLRVQIAQFKAMISMGRELRVIRQAFGIDALPGYSEKLQQDQSWLGKLARGTGKTFDAVTSLPGIDAVKNITNLVWKVGTTPFKPLEAIGKFTDTLINKFKGFLSGGLYEAQTDDDLARLSKRKVHDFVQDGGLSGALSSISFTLEKIYTVLVKQLDLSEIGIGKSVGREELKKLDDRGAYYFDVSTGAMTTQKGLRESRLSMMRDVYAQSRFGRFMTAMKSMRHPVEAFKRTSEETLEFEKGIAANVMGKTSNTRQQAIDRIGGKSVFGGKASKDDYKNRLLAFVGEENKNLSIKDLEELASRKVLEENISMPSEVIGGVGDIRKIMGQRGRFEEQSQTLSQRFLKDAGSMSAVGILGLTLAGILTGGAATIGGAALMAGGGLGAGLGIKGLFDRIMRRRQRETIISREKKETTAGLVDIISGSTSKLLENNNLIPRGSLPTISLSPTDPSIPSDASADDYGMVTAATLRGFSSIENQLINIYKTGLDYKELIQKIEENTESSKIVTAIGKVKKAIDIFHTEEIKRHGVIVDIFKEPGESSLIDDMVKHLATLTGGVPILPSPAGLPIPVFLTESNKTTKGQFSRQELKKKVVGLDDWKEIRGHAAGGLVKTQPGESKGIDTLLRKLTDGEYVIPKGQTEKLSEIGERVSKKEDDKKFKIVEHREEKSAETLGDTDSKIPAKRKGTIHSYLREIWEKATSKDKKEGEEGGGFFSKLFGNKGVLGGILGGLTFGGFMRRLFLGDKKTDKKGLFSQMLFGKGGKKEFLKRFGMKGLLGSIGGLIGAFFVGWNIGEGWMNAEKITQTKNPSFVQKIGAAAANVFSAATFGLVSPEKLYNIDKNITNIVSDGFSKIFEIPESLADMGNKMLKGLNFVHNWNHAEEIIKNPKSNFFQKAGAVAAGIGSFATFGLVKPETVYKGMTKPLNFLNNSFKSMFGENIWGDIKGFVVETYDKNMGNRISKLTGSNAGVFQTLGASFAVMSNFFFGSDEKWAYDQMAGAFRGFDKPFIKGFEFFTDLVNYMHGVTNDDFLKALLGDNYSTYKSVETFAKDTLGWASGKYVKNLFNSISAGETPNIYYEGPAQKSMSFGPGNKNLEKMQNQASGIKPKTVPTIPEKRPDFLKEFDENQKKRKNDTLGGSLSDIGGKLISGVKSVNNTANTGIGFLYDFFLGNAINTLTGRDKSKTQQQTKKWTKEDSEKAIQQASKKYGISYDYLKTKAFFESSPPLNPYSYNEKSGATGLFQALPSFWKDSWGKDAKNKDRNNPYLSADAAARYVFDNKKRLPLEFQEDPNSWYLIHNMGPSGARDFLTNLLTNKDMLLKDLNTMNDEKIRKNYYNKKEDKDLTLMDTYIKTRDLLSKKSKEAGVNDIFSKTSDFVKEATDKVKGIDYVSLAKEGIKGVKNSLVPGYKEGGVIPKFKDGGKTKDIVNKEVPVPSTQLGKIPQLEGADSAKDSVMVAAQPGELIFPKKLSGMLMSFFKKVSSEDRFSGKLRSQYFQEGGIVKNPDLGAVLDLGNNKDIVGMLKSMGENINKVISKESIDKNLKEIHNTFEPLFKQVHEKFINNPTLRRSQESIQSLHEQLNVNVSSAKKSKEELKGRQKELRTETARANQAKKLVEKVKGEKPLPPIIVNGQMEQKSNPIKSNYELPIDPIMKGIMNNFLSGALDYFDRTVHNAFVYGANESQMNYT